MTNAEFSKSYSQGYSTTVRFLLSRGLQAEQAEEIAQGAWAKGWERRGQLRQPDRIVAWVNSIALNILRNGLRKPAGEELPINLPSSQGTNLAAIDVKRSLARCRQRDRKILNLFYLEGYSSQEIAEAENSSSTAIRVRLHRARKRLADELTSWRDGARSIAATSTPQAAVSAG